VAEKINPAPAQRLIADNRKARHDYHLLETFEAGVALLGTEVKAIREGRVNLRDSYARVEGGATPSTTPRAAASCCSTGSRSAS